MERLWAVHEMLTRFTEVIRGKSKKPCGCIRRGDGVYLRYCSVDNKRSGTHGRVGGVAPPEE